MNTSVNTDDVIFNFFKQICDEKDDQKCVELGKEWIKAMETNLSSMEANLNGADYLRCGSAEEQHSPAGPNRDGQDAARANPGEVPQRTLHHRGRHLADRGWLRR